MRFLRHTCYKLDANGINCEPYGLGGPQLPAAEACSYHSPLASASSNPLGLIPIHSNIAQPACYKLHANASMLMVPRAVSRFRRPPPSDRPRHRVHAHRYITVSYGLAVASCMLMPPCSWRFGEPRGPEPRRAKARSTRAFRRLRPTSRHFSISRPGCHKLHVMPRLLRAA